MPIPVPNLDDRTYDRLASEARSWIPRHFPEWTDFNPSDPGVTLLELFAYLFEAAIYQANRVPDRTLENFARLAGVARGPGESTPHLLRRALDTLELKTRAITASELERQTLSVSVAVGRARVLPPGDPPLQIVIVPDDPGPAPVPTDGLRQQVFDALRQRAPIATRLQVAAPAYSPLSLDVAVALQEGSPQSRRGLQQAVQRKLQDWLSPLHGGKNGDGWEFGKSVYRSELFYAVEEVPGVDHVVRLRMNGSEADEVPLPDDASLFDLQGCTVTVI